MMTVPVKPTDPTPRLGPAPERIGRVGGAHTIPDSVAKGPKPLFWVLQRLVILAGGTGFLYFLYQYTGFGLFAVTSLVFPFGYWLTIVMGVQKLFDQNTAPAKTLRGARWEAIDGSILGESVNPFGSTFAHNKSGSDDLFLRSQEAFRISAEREMQR